MSRKYHNNSWLKLISIILGLFSFLSLFGAFKFTKSGIFFFSFFEFIMGDWAWAGPFLIIIISFLIWPSSSVSITRNTKGKALDKKINRRKNDKESKISIPATRLVSLKGFDEYFSSSDLLEENEPAASVEDIKELGKDFPSYFGEGEKNSIKFSTRLTTLQGLKDYFESVDKEIYGNEDIDNKNNEVIKFNVNDKKNDGSKNFIENKNIDHTYPEQVNKLINLTKNQNNDPKSIVKSEEELANDYDENAETNSIESFDVLNIHEPVIYENSLIEERISDDVDKNTVKDKSWKLPDLRLLTAKKTDSYMYETYTDSQQLEKVLNDFGVKAKIIRTTTGPVITRFELAPAPGVKISKIVNLADDIALALAANDVRIEAPIPGKAAVGIEVPNKNPRPVSLKEVLETLDCQEGSSKLKIALGADISNQPVVGNLEKMPHLLVAGATGSGKSVCITTIINSILFNATPDEVKFLLVDPKMVELSHYNGVPHLLAPVVTDPKKAATALKWIVKEMETRYELFASAGVRDISSYNRTKNNIDRLPLIVVIIDELADLMIVAAGEVEEAICRLAQMARAAGIHLVIATQRPSVDVITGLIKANIPSRISFAVTSQIDSRTILDSTGAEKLLGKGDMLYAPQGLNKPIRVQGCLVLDEEVHNVIRHWKAQGKPNYLDPEKIFNDVQTKEGAHSGLEDELFLEAGRTLISAGTASVSFLQRKFKLGYSRAARLIDMLEEQGVVGSFEGSKPRQILITLDEFNERFR